MKVYLLVTEQNYYEDRMIVVRSLINLFSGIALIMYGTYNYSKFRKIKSKELLSGFLAFMGFYGVAEFLIISSETPLEARWYLDISIYLLSIGISLFLLMCIEIYDKSSRKYWYLPVASLFLTAVLSNWLEVVFSGIDYIYSVNLAWALWLIVIVLIPMLFSSFLLLKLSRRTTPKMKRKIEFFSLVVGTTAVIAVFYYSLLIPYFKLAIITPIIALGFFIASSVFYRD